jgi:hypothetical protein
MRTNSTSGDTSPAAIAVGTLSNGGGGALPTNMTNYTTSLSLRVAGRTASTSPNRTITNGSIRNGNINRNNSNFHASAGSSEVNGNNSNIQVSPQRIMSTSMTAAATTTTTKDAAATSSSNGVAEKFEVPLPFGYHLDLDFLRVCSDDPSGETLEKLKELRKMRRKQRKTLEALMGFRQQQELRAVPEAKVAAVSRPARPVDLQLVSRQPDIVNSSELVREALR